MQIVFKDEETVLYIHILNLDSIFLISRRFKQ